MFLQATGDEKGIVAPNQPFTATIVVELFMINLNHLVYCLGSAATALNLLAENPLDFG